MKEPLRGRVKSGLIELGNGPELKGERLSPSMFWKVRVGDYRAMYEIDGAKKIVVVLFIGHRRVYEDFSRLLWLPSDYR